MRSYKLFLTPILGSLLLLVAQDVVFSSETRSPSLFAAETVCQALKEQGVAPDMKIISRTSADLREVVSRRLDPQLLAQTEGVAGRDFQYVFLNSSRTAQLGVIVLRYPSVPVAKRMIKLLTPLNNYFKNSKILIRFSAVPLDSLLVITYSENSGDDRIVKAINALPKHFQNASQGGTVYWSEPELSEGRR